jgi:hypothetical protein
MDSLLAVVFAFGLPVWLTVEQIVVLMRPTRPSALPVNQHVADGHPRVSYTYAEGSLTVTTIDTARIGNR